MKKAEQSRLNAVMGILGFLIAFYGVCSALFGENIYWYSFLVVGLFLFFDFTDGIVNRDSNIIRLFSGRWKTFIFSYIYFLVFTMVIDLLFGRFMSQMWVYPHYGFIEELIHVILIGYPLGFFSVSALYRTISGFIFKIDGKRNLKLPKSILSDTLAWLFVLMFVFSLCFPVINYFLRGNRQVHEVLVVCMMIGLFSVSPITYLISGDSFLLELIRFRKNAFLGLLISWIFSSLLNEVPNTYVWQWKYQNIPFTSFEILNVNIIVLTAGWLYLTVFGISGNELFFRLDSQRVPANGP
jgi:hypothetical protein